MGNTPTYKYSLPEGLKVDLQLFLKRVEQDLKVFGCVIAQDSLNHYKYIIDNNVFTVEDKTGNGRMIVENMLKDRYNCTLIKTTEDKEKEEDEGEDKKEDELTESMENCTLAAAAVTTE